MDTSFVKLEDILKKTILITESPIESMLLGALQKFGVDCYTQVQIGPYRIDILIKSKFLEIVIECDGKEFHKDKVKDAKRDISISTYIFTWLAILFVLFDAKGSVLVANLVSFLILTINLFLILYFRR